MRIDDPYWKRSRIPPYIGLVEEFPFRFDMAFRPMLLGLGVHPGKAVVTLTDDGRFIAKFGPWQVETPLSNIDCIEETGPYRWYKAIGVRGSAVDRGLTFGSTAAGGLCVTFHEPIPSLLPGVKHHPGLTVTVADPAGLAAAIVEQRSD